MLSDSEHGVPQRHRGTNLPKMGDFNQTVILDSIRRSDSGLSRVELAGSTGLAAQTVSNICRRLLDSELIMEAGKEILGAGKPRTILRINPDGMYAVGVHIDPAQCSIALVDGVGAVVESVEIPMDFTIAPEVTVKGMGDAIQALIAASGVDTLRIAGVGVATPGPVDLASGTVVTPPHMPGWLRVPLKEILTESTGLPVVMDKDVTASAVAELWTASSGCPSNFVYLYIGTGIGAGLVIGEEVVRGTSGNVGEIGHIIADPDGPMCDCGRRGCVKVTCMPETLLAEARRLGVLPAPSQNHTAAQPEELAELAELAAGGNEVAAGILSRAAVRFSAVISVMTNLLDADHVVFGGPFWPALSATFLAEVPALLERQSATRGVHCVQIAGTRMNAGAEAFGAACLLMERTYSPNAARLLLDSKS